MQDKQKAQTEASRVLRNNGQLVIYYTAFTGIETDEFQNWKQNCFFKKYPPVKTKRNFKCDELKTNVFPSFTETKYPDYTDVNIDELASLLMTMSGVVFKVEMNNKNLNDIKSRLKNELKPFFTNKDKLPFHWDITIWRSQKKKLPVRNECEILDENVYTRPTWSK